MHARRNGEIHTRQRTDADSRRTQYVAQLRRFAVRRPFDEGHPLDIHVRFEETVEQHCTLHPDALQRGGHRHDVRETHREFDRNGNLHLGADTLGDRHIEPFKLLRRTCGVDRLDEDVQFERRGSGPGHRGGVFDPFFARGHAVDAGDDGNPRRTPRIGDQLQKSRFVILAQITLQIVARIAVGRIGILFERSGVVHDLLLEDRFQNHRARSGGGALLDIGERRRIGRTAHDDRAVEFQSEIGSFHGLMLLLFDFDPPKVAIRPRISKYHL